MHVAIRALALAALILAPGPTRAAEYEPVEVPFTRAAQSPKEAAKAIKWTLLERRWRLDKESENTIHATLDRPDEQLRVTVAITFDQTKATISYVTSEMKLTRAPSSNSWATPQSGPISKSKYESWVGNLAKDIPVYLERLQVILS